MGKEKRNNLRNKKEGGEFKETKNNQKRTGETGLMETKRAVSKAGVWWAVSIADKLLVMVRQ